MRLAWMQKDAEGDVREKSELLGLNGLTKALQFLAQLVEFAISGLLAKLESVAEEELEEASEQVPDAFFELVKLLFGHQVNLVRRARLLKMTIDNEIDEIGNAHVAAVLFDLLYRVRIQYQHSSL
jgi:hypothetical protein